MNEGLVRSCHRNDNDFPTIRERVSKRTDDKVITSIRHRCVANLPVHARVADQPSGPPVSLRQCFINGAILCTRRERQTDELPGRKGLLVSRLTTVCQNRRIARRPLGISKRQGEAVKDHVPRVCSSWPIVALHWALEVSRLLLLPAARICRVRGST